MMTSIFIALGSNIDAEMNLKKAAEMLRSRWPAIRFSSVYKTKAIGYEDQDDFLNAVAKVSTDDSPDEIHQFLLSIEQSLKKSPPFRFGPRTIDLDLLLYGNEVINRPNLTVPHPRMHERRFVLEPLLELLEGSTHHPHLQSDWNRLKAKIKDQKIESSILSLD